MRTWISFRTGIRGMRVGISLGPNDFREAFGSTRGRGTVKLRDLVMSAVVVGAWIWLAYFLIFNG